MQKLKSKEKLLFQEVWRKAYNSPNGLTVKFKTEKLAYAARMALYNAIKAAKEGKEEDRTLNLAAEAIRLVWGEDKTVLILQHRKDSEVVQTLEELLGVKMDDMEDPTILESLQKIAQMREESFGPEPTAPGTPKPLPSAPFQHQDNPFYKKRS